ncbi:MAG: 50S ribosomal protein L18 [Candidatus Moranbacteria bacterium]|nr:50S ribosomal protein L18 [Candidatus Moranbacteria bacterium]
MMTVIKKNLRLRRRSRVRSKISGTAKRPRFCVFRSLKGLYVQVINDEKGRTLVSARMAEIKKAKNDIEGAKELGKLIAGKCKKAKIGEVVFDRGGYKYHGKVKSLADGAREGGLKF